MRNQAQRVQGAMSNLPSLTVLLGPQTSLSLALNAIIRDYAHILGKAGLHTFPNRLASPILRQASDERPADLRRAEFFENFPKPPAFLSALNFFGTPHEELIKREMFPRAEQSLARLAEIAPKMRVCICIDALPAFFMLPSSDGLEARVKSTSWEMLFELSWADLVVEVKAALPDSEIIVLTPKAAIKPDTLALLGIEGLPDPHLLLKSQISETGCAVLDRMEKDQALDIKVAAELFASFSNGPSIGEIQSRLGLDKVTQLLLAQRFDEDVAVLQAMPGIRVVA